MTAHPLQILFSRRIDTSDVIADLTGGYAVDHSLTRDHADRRQTNPQARVPDAAQVLDHATGAGLVAPAADFLRHALGELDSRLAILDCLFKRLLDVFVETWLILLAGQRVPASPLDDPGGNIFLTA